MRKWKQITGLAVLLAGLGALATWDEWKTKNEEKEKETKGLILTLKQDAVTGLRLRSTTDGASGDKTTDAAKDPKSLTDVTLKLTNGAWTITDPVSTLADQQVVKDLIKNLTDYKTESEVSDSKDQWAQFGLINARRDVEIEAADGKKISFFVGLNTPVGFSVYAATSASPKVYTGSQYIATATGKTLFDLREKKILTGSSAEVSAINLTSKNKQNLETISLSQADGKWLLKGPVSTPGDTVAVKNYLEDLFGLKAAEFFDNPSKDLTSSLSDKNLLGKIELTTKTGSTVITVSQSKDALYAQLVGQPTVYKLGDDARGKILKTVKDLRDKKIFSFGSTDVSKVTVDGESFSKVANDWYRSEDAGKFAPDGKFTGKAEEKPVAANHIRGLVVDLEYARAEDVFESKSDVAKNLPKAPKHRVILSFAQKEKDITIDIWTAQDNPEMIYLRRSGADQIVKTKRSIIASLTPAKISPVGNEAMGDGPGSAKSPEDGKQ